MIRFSGCIEMMFTDLPFERRFAAAAKAGLPAVEFWGWADKDLPAVAGAARDAGVAIAGCCLGTAREDRRSRWGRSGMLDARNAPLLCDMLRETLEATAALGCRTYIATVGQALEGAREPQHDAIVACLRAAAPIAEDAGVTLVVEPLNTLVDHAGHYLSRSDEALDILRAVGSPSVRLLYDIYHQQITEGNLIATIRDNIALIGHLHVADNPGRNEPGTGEINYANVFRAIDEAGYDRYVGLEYRPTIDAAESVKRVYGFAGMGR